MAYDTPGGQQLTTLKKKRQFLIAKGQIESMFDTNETVGDEMLQHVFGEQNDETMQNIVATIQREQNDIIRDTRSDLLVVQGVAALEKRLRFCNGSRFCSTTVERNLKLTRSCYSHLIGYLATTSQMCCPV